jgi:predicted nucleic acid-binding protein
MIFVADSSPLIVLINIDHIDVLPRLFGQVVIPPEISVELSVPTRPQAVRDFGNYSVRPRGGALRSGRQTGI